MMDVELRITLLIIGALIIVGLIFADRIKRKKRADSPYKRFEQSEDFELPSMSATHESPSHDELDGLRIDEGSSTPMAEANIVTGEIADEVEPVILDSKVDVDSAETEISDFGKTVEIPRYEGEGVAAEESAEDSQQDSTQPGSESDPTLESELEDPGMVLSLLILAPKGEPFRGSQIKMAMKEVGFEFGKMDIFHINDGDEPLVSVANVLEPGTFDLEEMTSIKIPGLVIFTQLPAARTGAEIYDTWYRSTKKLKAALSGRLADMRKQPLAEDYFEKLRSEAETYPASNPQSL